MKKVSNPILFVTLTGYPAFRSADQAWKKLPTLKAEGLIVYLLTEKQLNGNIRVTKEALVDLFWPGMPLPSALQNLRQTIYQVRKAFAQSLHQENLPSDTFLATDRKNVWLSEFVSIRSDLDWYLDNTATRTESAEAWVSLYAKPFLENFSIPNTPAFDEWIERCRQKLQTKYIQLLETALATSQYQEDIEFKTTIYKALLQKDPFSERYHYAYLDLLNHQGKKNQAIQIHQNYMDLLKDELGIELSQEIESLYTNTSTSSNPAQEVPNLLLPSTKPRSSSILYPIAFILAVVSLCVIWLWNTTKDEGVQEPFESVRIAIIPMQNYTQKDYLADGVTDDLLTGLTKLKGVTIISRQSTTQFRDSTMASDVIGQELQVDFLLRGNITQFKDQYKVNVQFLETQSGQVMWAESYSRDTNQITSFQKIIIEDLTQYLNSQFDRSFTGQLPNVLSSNAGAYQAYLAGRYAFYKANPKALHQAIDYFNQAIELDPTFDLAHAWLAWTYCSLAGSWGDESAEEMYPMVQSELAKIEGNPDLKSIYYKIQGWMHLWMLDRKQAEIFLRQSVEIDPNEEFGLSGLAMVLTLNKSFSEAIQIGQEALVLNPHFFWNHFVLGQAYYYQEAYMPALQAIENGLELFGNHQASIGIKSKILTKLGKEEEAINYLNQSFSQFKTPPTSNLGDLGLVYAKTQQTPQAIVIANDLVNRHQKKEKYAAYFAAKIFSVLGNYEKAIGLLEDAYQKRDNELNWLEVDFEFEPLYDQDRFRTLAQKLRQSQPH